MKDTSSGNHDSIILKHELKGITEEVHKEGWMAQSL